MTIILLQAFKNIEEFVEEIAIVERMGFWCFIQDDHIEIYHSTADDSNVCV